MFSLVCALPSPASAEACASLVDWFTGTTAQSDFSSTCMSAVWFMAFADRLFFRTRRTRDLPVLVHVVSQRARVLRLRRTEQPLANSVAAVLPSSISERSRHPDPSAFRSSIAPPTGTSGLRFTRHLTVPPARLEARMESLFSFPVGLFHPLQHAGLSRRTPVSRQGLSRWRGGRYRVVNQESSGTTDIVWVIGKGDSCDPFTQDDAGGTPASRLFCHHHTQLLAGGDRVRQVFRQVSRQARPQRTSNLSSLSADRAQTDARHGGQPGSGAALLFRQDAQAPSVSRVLTVPPGPASAADGAEPGGSLAADQWRRKPVSTDVADDTLRHRHATRRTRASQGRRRR